MHCGQLADPLNPFAKALSRITGKRKKTEADYEEMARIEFLGGLYTDENSEPCIPGEMFEGVLIAAAKKTRRGNEAKAGIICGGTFRLEYKGPHTPDGLWAEERFRLRVGVKVNSSRVIRTRPIFRDWATEVSIDFMPDQLNPSDIEEMVRTAGYIIGIGDWRPKFGRFRAEGLS